MVVGLKKWAIEFAVMKYARGIAKTLGVPVEQVLTRRLFSTIGRP
jgi:hypothetical protein